MVRIAGFSSSEWDITDSSAAEERVTAGSVVINCAGYTAVDRAEEDLEAATAVNVRGPAVLARACAEAGAHLIHLSTDYVFPGTLPAGPDRSSFSGYEPDDATDPRSVYGRTKLAGEQAVLAVGADATIVRTAWVYTGTGSDFVSTMRRLERERETVEVVTDQLGSPTYAHDLAAGLLELASSVRAGTRILHATNAGIATWFDLARATFELVGADPARVRPTTSNRFVRPAPRPAYSVLSGRSWAAAGLTPLRDWRPALAAAIAEVTSVRHANLDATPTGRAGGAGGTD